MARLETCKECGSEYSPNHPLHQGGHAGVCGWCERKDDVEVRKTVGVNCSLGKTNYWLEILPHPSASQIRLIRTQGRCGPGQCHTSLGLSSNGGTTAKKDLDRVLANIYPEDAE